MPIRLQASGPLDKHLAPVTKFCEIGGRMKKSWTPYMKVLWAAVFAVTAWYSIWLVLSPSVNMFRDMWLNSVLNAIVLLLVTIRIVATDRDRAAFVAFLVGLLAWTVADLLCASEHSLRHHYEAGNGVLLNLIYMGSYVSIFIGIVLLLRKRLKEDVSSRQTFLNGATIVALACGYLTLFAPNVFDYDDPNAVFAFLIAGNVFLETAIVALLLSVMNLTRAKLDPMWWCVIGGTTILWFTDIRYFLKMDYSYWDKLDFGWTIAFLLIALAAWVRSDIKLNLATGAFPLLTPVVTMILSIALLLWGVRHHIPLLSAWCITIASILSIIRILQIMRTVYFAEKLTKATFTDPLTGLYNKIFLETQLKLLEEELAEERPTPDRRYSLLLVKIKTLRGVNEALGIDAGDTVLRQMGADLLRLVPEAKIVARLQAGTFAVLTETDNPERTLAEQQERIIPHTHTPAYSAETLDVFTEFVYAASTWPSPDVELHGLVQKADVALAAAEKTNTTRIWYTPELEKEGADQFVTEQLFRAALRSDEIVCYYQPKLNVATGEILGMEALVRWVRPEQGVVPPALFLPAVKQAGLMNDLTKRVLTVAVRQTKQWHVENMPLRISVNLSITDFIQEGLTEFILDTLQASDLPGEHLMLEITETETLERDNEAVAKIMEKLIAHGISLSLDDYGTGSSTLERLRAFPFKELKFDRSFIGGIGHDPNVQDLVKSTTNLAHKLMGLTVVAEGVETEEDYTQIVHAGCDIVQGHYVCAPKSPKEVTRWLKNYNLHRRRGEVNAFTAAAESRRNSAHGEVSDGE